MASRRTVLIGIGAAVAGGGALFATGAFTTVEAQRTVSVNTAGDAAADLGIEVNDDYDGGGDTASIELGGGDGDGLGPGRYYGYPPLLAVTNNTGLGDLDIEVSLDDTPFDTVHTEDVADLAEVDDDELGFEFVRVDSFSGTEDNFSENVSDEGNLAAENPVGDGESALYSLDVVTPDNFDDYEDFDLEITITADQAGD